jgi:L-seryl-tRNA(Ser) seleniumtransferase
MDGLLSSSPFQELCETYGRARVKSLAGECLDETRSALRKNPRFASGTDWTETILALVRGKLDFLRRPGLGRVLNATGVIIHTNLGRAPLPAEALQAVADASCGYSNLEFHLEDGRRGKRGDTVEALLCRLTGAESAHAVNNNAAAVFLALAALSKGKEAVVSRGELIEIGASFRIPDICTQSGAHLREVGTTNKTRLSDYRAAIGRNTGCLLKVHPSNYRITGFSQAVPAEAMALLARRHRLPMLYDLGGGFLGGEIPEGFREPGVAEALRSGADVIMFSGDKLLGGPQAGILVGRKKFIEPMKRHPLSRALRLDKMTLAALEAVLRLHLLGRGREIPVMRMIGEPVEAVRKRAEESAAFLKSRRPSWKISVAASRAKIGGGTTPEQEIPSSAVALSVPGLSPDKLAALLRRAPVPVVTRIAREHVLLDFRTLACDEMDCLHASLLSVP